MVELVGRGRTRGHALPGSIAVVLVAGTTASGAARLSAAEPAPRSPVLSRLELKLLPRNVTKTPDYNEWNPRYSADGKVLSFERRDGSAQALFLVDPQDLDRAALRVSSLPPRALSAEEALLGSQPVDDTFNAQLTFFPDGRRFVFTGNGGTGIYRLYEGALTAEPPRAVTPASKEDGHPAISPDGRYLVYVSARGGIGKLVLRDLATGVERWLTEGDQVDLFPSWSPDSRSIAYTSGDNDNHDVFLIRDVTLPDPAPLQLTRWRFDDLRPIFSPDGSLIAFYSNYSPTGEDREWCIVTVPADGSGPSKGLELGKRAVAVNVTKDPEVGPAWLPWGRVLVFARNLKAEWNPIYMLDVDTGEERRVETTTRMNHDLTCSTDGWLAFRAQVASWDDIFVSPLLRIP